MHTSINAVNHREWRPLHCALHSGEGGTAALLLDRGAENRPPPDFYSSMRFVSDGPPLPLDLLPRLIDRRSNAVPVAAQIAEAQQIAQIYGKLIRSPCQLGASKRNPEDER